MTAQVRNIVLHASANETASGNSADFPELPSDGPGVLYLDVTAESGTSPTLDIDLETKDPLSGKYFVVLSLAQQTAVGTLRVVSGLEELPDGIYRIKWVIGGTASPNFTFSLGFTVKDRG